MLDRFDDVGLIDDEAFARAWVDSRQRRKHLSARALRAELARKGVDRETIAGAVGQVSREDEHAAALELARSRAGRLAGLDAVTRRRRLSGLLARRGFGPGVIAPVLAEVLAGGGDDPDSGDDVAADPGWD